MEPIAKVGLIYSAALSTLVFIWGLIKHINQNRRRLKIRFTVSNHRQTRKRFLLKDISETFWIARGSFLDVEVLNNGNRVIFIYDVPVVVSVYRNPDMFVSWWFLPLVWYYSSDSCNPLGWQPNILLPATNDRI